MARTQLRPEQLRAVDDNTVSNAEVRFGWFCGVATTGVLLVGGSLFFPDLQTFWAGNRLWSLGSLFVCISVLQSRFFDVRRRASPFNQRIDESMLVPRWRVLERITAHLWLAGFVLLGASRWINY